MVNENNKIPVTILGATGVVGQRFIQLLIGHPLFYIASLVGSDRSAGRAYAEACRWQLPDDMPELVRDMVVHPIEPNVAGKIAFSALPAQIAVEEEPKFAAAGYYVSSNASSYRQAPDVPLIIPEINAEHVLLVEHQQKNRKWQGCIVTNPNCTTTAIAMPLKPLHDAFYLEQVMVTSLQAVSGAGYPGHPALDILDNVIPYIGGEEEKIEKENNLILGAVENGKRIEADFILSAQVNRVPVIDGHTVCLAMKFKKKPSPEEAMKVMSEYRASKLACDLPSAAEYPIKVRLESDRPQPRRDRDAGNGMVATVGRVRRCTIFDLKMVSVAHNTIRGAAGCSILNAELLVSRGYVK